MQFFYRVSPPVGTGGRALDPTIGAAPGQAPELLNLGPARVRVAKSDCPCNCLEYLPPTQYQMYVTSAVIESVDFLKLPNECLFVCRTAPALNKKC